MFWKSLISFDSLINILIPRACLLCRTLTHEAHHLCVPCSKELPILSYSCQKCAQFLHASERRQLTCGQCLTNPPPFDIVFALFPYQPPLPKLVAGLKFEEQFSIAGFFSTMLSQTARQCWYANTPLPDLILPMPLHNKRLQERGYNQAAEIAKPAARRLNIPLDEGVLRSKYTLPQSTLPAASRRQNTANAFTARRSYDGVHIAVVDDVMTTGHTVAAISRLLKRCGARRVDIWCCARCDSRL
jgi:ComF family protein